MTMMYADKDSYVHLVTDVAAARNDSVSLELLKNVEDVSLQYLTAAFSPLINEWTMVNMFNGIICRILDCLSHELVLKLKVNSFSEVDVFGLNQSIRTRQNMPATEEVYSIVENLIYGSGIVGNGLESFSYRAGALREKYFGVLPVLAYTGHHYFEALKKGGSYVLPQMTDTDYTFSYVLDMLSIAILRPDSETSFNRTKPFWDLLFKTYTQLKEVSEKWGEVYGLPAEKYCTPFRRDFYDIH